MNGDNQGEQIGSPLSTQSCLSLAKISISFLSGSPNSGQAKQKESFFACKLRGRSFFPLIFPLLISPSFATRIATQREKEEDKRKKKEGSLIYPSFFLFFFPFQVQTIREREREAAAVVCKNERKDFGED